MRIILNGYALLNDHSFLIRIPHHFLIKPLNQGIRTEAKTFRAIIESNPIGMAHTFIGKPFVKMGCILFLLVNNKLRNINHISTHIKYYK